MIVQRVKGIHSLLITLQGVIAAALFWLWFWIFVWFYPQDPGLFMLQYGVYCALLVAGIGIEPLFRGTEKIAAPLYQKNLIKQLPVALRQTAFSVGLLLLFLVLAKDPTLSRVFFVSFLPILYGMLLLTNYFLPEALARHFFRGDRVERTLLVGPSFRAKSLSHWLQRKKPFGVHSVGILCGDDEIPPEGIPRLGRPEDIGPVLRETAASQVILLEIPETPAASRFLVEASEQFGARLLILSNLQEKLHRPVVNFDDDGLNFISFHQEPLENPFNRLFKRLADLLISSAVLLLVFPPLAVIVWLVHRLQSPGPLFFVQTRAGIQNKKFNIIKFRTMHMPGAKPVAEEDHDPSRIFGVARFLRRYSLDEIPQFLNVFRGEMSVVGPRPHLLVHNDQFAQVMKNYHVRSLVKPGITGLAQVRGFRGEARTLKDIEARLQSDISYLENWSPALDIAIFFRTIYQMVFPPAGAR